MNEIKSLTSLRGLAAMAVVMQHFSATLQQHAAQSIPSLVPRGYLAVDLFFVLSGFVMAFVYHSAFRTFAWATYRDFMYRRFARIVPLHTVALLVILVLGWCSSSWLGRNFHFASENLPLDVLANLLMLQGLGVAKNLNGPSWSISTEFLMYVAFPALLALTMHSPRRLAVITLLAVSTLVSVAMAQPKLGLTADSALSNIGRCFSGFVFGLISFRFFQMESWRKKLQSDVWLIPIIAWMLIFVALRIDLVTVFAFPPLVLALACNEGIAKRWLSGKVLYFLGTISYSIYLLHDLFRPYALHLSQVLHPEKLSAPLALSIALLGSLIVIPFAWLAYVCVERPGREFVQHIVNRHAP